MTALAAPVTPARNILEPVEEASILYVREEEKLARDTYITLNEIWDLQVFANISASEQNHMDSMLGLIEKYNLDDPALPEIGAFTNTFLQGKYFELVDWGSASKADALLVGCFIEELDILDLAQRLEKIDNRDIRQVFGNLIDGSENHLRAFVSNYESLTGITYEPVILDATTYNQIIGSNSDSGGGGGGYGGGGGGRR